MAEVSEANADPSMEEILASIRKIISDENPPALATPEAEAAPQEDVLELTQMVQNDGSVVDIKAEPEVVAVNPPAPPPPPVMAAAPPPQLPPVAPSEPLISDPVANSAASALSSLASTVEIERLSAAPSSATYIGNGGRTLEDMAIELMRPLLKDWLDKNLPAVVDRLVQKEIERIVKRS
jgi:cell pole-organizing protein PopZ